MHELAITAGSHLGEPLSWSLLAVGFLMGLRHATEADHLAAVAALAAAGASRREALRAVAAWGTGHAVVLVAAAAAMGLARRGIPETQATGLEVVAGFVLLVLGVDVLRRARRRRLGFHDHADGTRHWHVHDRPEHVHVRRPLARALAVGGVHGLAGSAVIGIVAVDGLVTAIGYAALLGIGAALGMLLLTAGVTVPLGRRGGPRLRTGWIEAAAGTASLLVGTAWMGRALLALAAG